MRRESDRARERRVLMLQLARRRQLLQTGLIAAGVVVACVFTFLLARGGSQRSQSVAQAPPLTAAQPPPSTPTTPACSAGTPPGPPYGPDPRDEAPLPEPAPAASLPQEGTPEEPSGAADAATVVGAVGGAPEPPNDQVDALSDEPPAGGGGIVVAPPIPVAPPEGVEPSTRAPKTEPPTGPPPAFGAGKSWPKPTPQHVKSVDHGVAIVPPPDWRSIPPPKEVRAEYGMQQEAVQVYSFKDKRDTDPDHYEISMSVWVVAQAKDAEDAFAKWARTEQYAVQDVKLQPLKVGPWEARHGIFVTNQKREVLTQVGQDRAPAYGFNKDVTVIFEGGRAGIVEFTSGVRYGKKRADIFLRSARSFLFLSSESVAKEKAKSDGGTELPKGWTAFCTAHYEIQYNCDKPFAEEVGRHLELILKEYERRFPMPEVLEAMKGTGKQRRFTVKVFKTNEEFDSYAHQNGVNGAAAYFSPSQDELVCYRTTEQGKKKTFHIIYHEASHQYVHVYFGYDVGIPIWVDEGVAEYFYGGELLPNGGVRIEENKDRLPRIKEAIRTHASVPVADIMRYTQAQYYANPDVCYAEGWSLAYFFWQTKDKTYAGRLDRFYRSLKASGDTQKAIEEAFGDLDMKALEEDWRRFVLGL